VGVGVCGCVRGRGEKLKTERLKTEREGEKLKC
jgi:hypothetical protein